MEVLLQEEEQLVLYALVRGLNPKNVLEVGVYKGGSSNIMHEAMLANGIENKLFAVDIKIRVEAAEAFFKWDNATLVIQPSDKGIHSARQQCREDFDFVFIDGDHWRNGLFSDLTNAYYVTKQNGVILLHDAHNKIVNDTIDEYLDTFPDDYLDCGILVTKELIDEAENHWGGLRMLRVK